MFPELSCNAAEQITLREAYKELVTGVRQLREFIEEMMHSGEQDRRNWALAAYSLQGHRRPGAPRPLGRGLGCHRRGARIHRRG